jgi:hypothetical protein
MTVPLSRRQYCTRAPPRRCSAGLFNPFSVDLIRSATNERRRIGLRLHARAYHPAATSAKFRSARGAAPVVFRFDAIHGLGSGDARLGHGAIGQRAEGDGQPIG